MAYTALPTKNPGDLITSALWNTYLQGNADSGFVRMLADTTLGANAANVAFSSIPAMFAHLLAVIYGRSDTVATSTWLLMRMNGDSAANYSWEQLYGNTNTATAGEGASATSMVLGTITAASATASHVGISCILIPNYAGTALFKAAAAFAAMTQALTPGNMYASVRGGVWANTAAINQLTFLPAAGNFITGSRFTLYGLPQ